ncbi:MAG: 4-(cytidine 5'-diphospho)-2-C-methyl-D-erythritol kinase [Bacteroidales bacterium]|nr:4-(cytidine 5'-diphospho)-2-C-methyl-D-erythritol kinase [Bacteroidales bacterium]
MITRPNVKINLGLHVLGKREDGFHDIETLMLPVNFFQDELEINISDRFNARIGAGWKESEDLTVRAYRQLSQTYHNMPPVSIRLVKHAPVGAGLGGGSADGAFALKMLNELCNLKMNEEVMLRQATRLGSDCPFFIHNIPMIATGKGDVLEPYDIDLKHFTVKIIVPQGIRINTAEAYKDVEDHRGMSLKEALSYPVDQWKDVLVNDFEKTVFAAHPQLAQLKQQMYDRGAIYASMSGSGSAIYGLFVK